MTTLALIGGFLLLMGIGVPVGISLAGASLLYVIFEGVQPHLVVLHRMIGGTDSFPLDHPVENHEVEIGRAHV